MAYPGLYLRKEMYPFRTKVDSAFKIKTSTLVEITGVLVLCPPED
jgi:hypothetical protein